VKEQKSYQWHKAKELDGHDVLSPYFELIGKTRMLNWKTAFKQYSIAFIGHQTEILSLIEVEDHKIWNQWRWDHTPTLHASFSTVYGHFVLFKDLLTTARKRIGSLLMNWGLTKSSYNWTWAINFDQNLTALKFERVREKGWWMCSEGWHSIGPSCRPSRRGCALFGLRRVKGQTNIGRIAPLLHLFVVRSGAY